jgi:Pro-kumamolisin, activation domain/Divergent InlB B-repeat domain/S-layer homology domain
MNSRVRQKICRETLFRVLALSALTVVLTPAGYSQTASRSPLITQAIDAKRWVTLAGNTRSEAKTGKDLGPVDDALHLDMYLQLKRSPEQELAAEKFVASLTDPASPNFHKWITATEYGQRFGASSEDVATISRWLESHGFTVSGMPSPNMVIDFSGNAGQVREAFHTAIHTFQVAGERHFANVSDPQIPAALSPALTGIVSLHNFRPRPMFVPKAQYTVAGSVNYYLVAPGDLATIYNFNPAFSAGYTGLGQTIVVVEDTNLYNGAGDWDAFRSTFGLSFSYPSGSLSEVHPGPGAGGTCSDPGVNGDDSEAAIDVEWATAAAPNAAVVLASCADTSTNFGGFIALQNMLTNGGPLPGIVSISYGESETQNGAAANAYINMLYQMAAAEGVSVFVAAGDWAAAVSDAGSTEASFGINVSGFASTTYNVAVGGTDFGDYASGNTSSFWNSTNGAYYASAKSYVPEIPWNDSCGSVVLANYLGFSTTYGPTGFCNNLTLPNKYYLNVTGGSGGPSGCATGSPSVANTVSGTCAGYAKPAYQTVLGNPSDGVRDVPDVALFAANGLWGHYYVVCFSDPRNGGSSCAGPPSTWAGFGGTSVATPIMAGIQALINQAIGSTGAGNPNPSYYQIAQNEYSTPAGAAACNSNTGPAATCSFNDVTRGDTDIPCIGSFNCFMDGQAIGVLSTSDASYAPAYGAAAGWDFATGIGTVNAFNLLNAFVSSVSPPPVLVSPVNGAVAVPVSASLTWNSSIWATSYDVYLGTSNPPIFVTNVTTSNYTPASLAGSTPYFWKIVAKSGSTSSSSPVWSFTTSAAPSSVTLTLNQSGDGTVTANPPASGGSYSFGAQVCLTATPSAGWLFGAWSGATLDASNCLVMNGNYTVTAYFVQTTAQFNDVPPTASYFDAVNLMFEAGVTTGCVQGATPQTRSFCPLNNITRQELAAFIVRAVTGTTNPAIYNSVPYFTDVPATNPFFPNIQKLMALDITTGCGTGLFCPTNTIPRWEMAVFIVRARLMLFGATFTTATAPYFADVPANVEGNGMPFPFIQRSYEEHVTNGCGTNPLIYCPDDLVTRGQMASFVMRALFNETTILGPSAPQITSVVPNAMASAVGTQLTVTITGVNTAFQTGDSVAVPSGMLAVTNVVVHSPTSISATLTVLADILVGPQALVVTTGGQNLTLPLAIKVGTY